MNRHGSLNRIYRLVWSQLTKSWVAVAENVKGRGKVKNQAKKLVAAALALSAVTLLLPEAVAGPTGGSVVSGKTVGTISQSGLPTTISQNTQYARLNWITFNIAATETVTFNQPSKSAVAVNQIADTNGSSILGHLNANGEIFLINPNGLVFGKDAVVNVGGMVASALGTTGTDAASMHFSGTGSVVNHGSITADKYSQTGGLVGWNYGGTVSHSVWDTQTTGTTNSSGGGTGLSDAQMKDQANFVAQGWDFVNTWAMPQTPGYPVLRSIPDNSLLGSSGSPPPPPGKPPKCHGQDCRHHRGLPRLAARFTELDFYFLKLLEELKSNPDKAMLPDLQVIDDGMNLLLSQTDRHRSP